MLGPFVAYRVPILMVVALVVAWSWYRLVRSHPPVARRSKSLALAILASVALMLAISAPLWENQLARRMWDDLTGAG